MSPRRRRVEKARPLAILTASEMRDRMFQVVSIATWEATKHRWPRVSSGGAPESFWRWEGVVPDELRRRHPPRPDGPTRPGPDGELHAHIRRFREQRHRREAWLEEHGGDWRALLDRSCGGST